MRKAELNAAPAHGSEAPSAWVQRWSHLAAPGGVVLDVACGQGRHARWFHGLGHPVVMVDRAQAAIDSIDLAGPPSPATEKVVADIENGPWPFAGRRFDAVVVTNYLWRPLLPTLLDSLAEGGLLIYETFTQGQETIGKPSRPDFLLRPGELLTLCRDLRVVAYEDGFLPPAPSSPGATGRFVQRIAAAREPGPTGLAADPAGAVRARYRLG